MHGTMLDVCYQQTTNNPKPGRNRCYLGRKFYNVYLTKREIECVYYLVRGKTAKEIGVVLVLSRRTVESYIDNVKTKLCCNTRTQLIEKILNLDVGGEFS